MTKTPRRAALLLALALLLAGCAGSGQATITPAPTGAPPTVAPPTLTPDLSQATAAPGQGPSPIPGLPTEAPTLIGTPTPAPGQALPAPAVAGRTILNLGVGMGERQVAVTAAGNGPLLGPPSFRIGADGSIRLLDAGNKRVLFYSTQGELLRELALPEAVRPLDFIVNGEGEIFVYDRGDADANGPQFGQRVLRYGPDGALAETVPISERIVGDAIMLTSDQHLVLVQDNRRSYLIIHAGQALPPAIQPATGQIGAVTPRSPVIFHVDERSGNWPLLDINSAYSGGPNYALNLALFVPPGEAAFFNVDRGMNLYLTDFAPGAQSAAFRRVAPDGAVIGAGRIDLAGCSGLTWRGLYIDQEGAAWRLCTSVQGVQISRYDLVDAGGAPLPPAGEADASVDWHPAGSSFAA